MQNASVAIEAAGPDGAALRPHRGGRGAALGAYAFGCLAYWAIYVASVLISGSATFWMAARWALLGVLPDCLLAIPALAFSRRVPWGSVTIRRFLLRHIFGAGLFILLASLVYLLALTVERRLTTGAWAIPPVIGMIAWKGLGSLFVYTTICGLGNTIEQARRAACAEVLRAEAQLAALRARLNPHFILNLLHTLMGLVAREPAAAEAALERLGDVLRYALRVQSEGLDEVRLREEWDFIERYLALERLRLGGRLRVRLEAEDDLMDAIVPAFSLQPLVENAVRHAIAPRAGGGTVIVTSRREGSDLVLEVEDDGALRDEDPQRGGTPVPGGTPEPGAGVTTPGSGLGLRLIRERLSALYGGAARLETGRSALGGFRAAVTLPLARPPGTPS